MKLQLSIKKIKTLSTDNKTMPTAMTPKVAGGFNTIPFTHDFVFTCSEFGVHTCKGIP